MAKSNRCTPIALLVAAAAAGAQGLSPESLKPSQVEGVVVNALTGKPVPKPHVTFRVPNNEAARAFGAVSSADGKFFVGPIDPAEYRVKVQRPGYLMRGEGIAVKIGPGDRISDLALKLMPEAVIAGRVIDANGDPVEGIEVEAVRAGPRSEQKTDARGEFRIGRLPAGKYLIRAVPSSWSQKREIRIDGSEDQHYGLTYFPGTLREEEAAVVEALPAAETGGITIRLARTPAARISGALTNVPEGAKKFHLRLTEVRWAHEMSLAAPRFELWGLPNGRYSLWTMCTDLRGRLWQSAYMEFETLGANIENLDLPLMLPFEMRGRIDWDGPAARPVEGHKPGLRLQPFIAWAESDSTEVHQDGTFLFAEAVPGRYRIALEGMPENVYVKSVRQDSVEMPNQVLDVRRGMAGPVAAITLSGKGAQLSGVVRGAEGPIAEVSVGLSGDGAEGFDFFRTVQTGADGSYAISGIAPGKYYVFVFDSEDTAELRKNRRLPFYVHRLERFEAEEGARISRDFKVE